MKVRSVLLVTMIVLAGCSFGAPGADVVGDEFSFLEDSVLDGATVRVLGEGGDTITCRPKDTPIYKKSFLTIDGRGMEYVRDAFISEYERRSWEVIQYEQEGLGIVRLVAFRPDDRVRVDIMIHSSGGIDLGSVMFTPCGGWFTRRLTERTWDEVPVGS